MSERSDGGAIVAVCVILVLLLLVVTGGGAFYVFVARRMVAQEMIAREAAVKARQAAEQARQAIEAQARTDAISRLESPNPDASQNAAIEAVLRAQETAWNSGNIDKFMEHYWKSDELTFSSGGKTTRGWNDTLNRYREKYPTTEKMGQLSFGELEFKPLGTAASLVLGQWALKRESEPVSGNFSLVVQLIDGKWVIIHDHTSRLAE